MARERKLWNEVTSLSGIPRKTQALNFLASRSGQMFPKCWIFCVITFVQAVGIGSIVFIEIADINSFDQSASPSRNCSSCSSGYGAVIPCTGATDTVCAQCILGFFSSKSSRDPCQECSSCHDDEYEVNHCSLTSDVVCRKCSICKPGFGLVKPCGKRSDTVCGLCPKSDEGRYFLHCHRCTKCGIENRQETFAQEEARINSISDQPKRVTDRTERKIQVSSDILESFEVTDQLDEIRKDRPSELDTGSLQVQPEISTRARANGKPIPQYMCCADAQLPTTSTKNTTKVGNTSSSGDATIPKEDGYQRNDSREDAAYLKTTPGKATLQNTGDEVALYTTRNTNEGGGDEKKGHTPVLDWTQLQPHHPTGSLDKTNRGRKMDSPASTDQLIQPTQIVTGAGLKHKRDKVETKDNKDRYATARTLRGDASTSPTLIHTVATDIESTSSLPISKENSVTDWVGAPKQETHKSSEGRNGIIIGIAVGVCLVLFVATFIAVVRLSRKIISNGSGARAHAPLICGAPSDCCDDRVSEASFADEFRHHPAPVHSLASHETISSSEFTSNTNRCKNTTNADSHFVAADVHAVSQEVTNFSQSLIFTEIKHHIFDSTEGQLCGKNSNIVIKVDHGTIPDGVTQPLYYRVIYDATPLLKARPEGPDRTLISPVFECGPSDAQLKKPVEIVVPHCLCLDETGMDIIKVFRCDSFRERVPVWEEVPPASGKTNQSKAWFTVNKDTVNIRTRTFSFWSIFACDAGPKKKRVSVFASKPSPGSDKIYLRFYVYSDNDDSKRRIELQEKSRFVDSVHCTKEKPFKMHNDNKDLTVSLTELEDGWILDKTLDTQTYSYESGYHNGFRAKDSCDFVVKPTRPGVNSFCCILKFNQEDHKEHTVYVDAGMIPTIQSREESNSNNMDISRSLEEAPDGSEVNSDESRDFTCECTLEESSEVRPANQSGVQEVGTAQCFVTIKNELLKASEADSRPVSDATCNIICEDVGVHWKKLLRSLLIKETTIDVIEEENRRIQERSYQGLLTWKKLNGPAATTGKLVDALVEIGKQDSAAKVIAEEYSRTTPDYQSDGPGGSDHHPKVTPV